MNVTSCGLGPQGLDLSRWTERWFTFSEFELRFRIPGGQTPYSGRDSNVSDVDLDRDLTSEKSAIGVFHHWWDFDVGLWKGVMGTLGMGASVHKRPDDYTKDLMSVDNLQELIHRELERYHAIRNQERSQKGQARFNVLLPKTYRRVNIAGHSWLVYSLGGFIDRTLYATPLTSTYYLTVSFDFVDNSRGYKTDWRKEAQIVADKIAASLEIRE